MAKSHRKIHTVKGLNKTIPKRLAKTYISCHLNRRDTDDVVDLHVPVNLLGLPVATQQTTQDPHAAHPAQLLWHTGVGGTFSLTCEKGIRKRVNCTACMEPKTYV